MSKLFYHDEIINVENSHCLHVQANFDFFFVASVHQTMFLEPKTKGLLSITIFFNKKKIQRKIVHRWDYRYKVSSTK